ncbi:MAG: hypothetical protein OIF57_17180 [Marinobacterium sp.]|nr:hypothetical protein [Marinobacterium sp.]
MRLLICLSSTELTLTAVEDHRVLRRLQLELPFQAQQLDTVLNALPPGIRADLLVDLIDEDRFTESVARVMPWEQEALLRRILRRRKGDEALLYTRWLGTHKTAEGRTEKQVQVVSLSEPEELQRLLKQLLARQIHVTRIYSLSELLSDVCISRKRRRKKDDDRADLILVRTAERTYRQILVVDGISRLSRQVQLTAGSLEELQQEQSGFERFIMVQRLVPFGQAFRYTLVGWDVEEVEHLRQACALDTRAEVVEKMAASHLREQVALLSDSPAQALLLYSLGRRSPPAHYQLPEWQRMRKQYLIRRSMVIGSVCMMVAALLQSVSLGVRTWNHQQVLAQMKGMEMHYLRQAKVNEARANLPANARDIRDGTEFVETVLQQRNLPGLEGEMVGLSRVLLRYPEVTLNSLRWQRPKLAELEQQTLQLTLSITPDADTSLAWLSVRLEQLLAAFEQIPAVETVERSKLPIDTNTDNDLQLALGEKRQTSYQFDVTIEMKHEKASR